MGHILNHLFLRDYLVGLSVYIFYYGVNYLAGFFLVLYLWLLKLFLLLTENSFDASSFAIKSSSYSLITS